VNAWADEAGTGARAGVRAVLLDLDGTLVLSEGVHRRCWQHFFDYWGVSVDEAEYRRGYMGRRPADVIREVAGPWAGSDTEAAVRVMTGFALGLVSEVVVVPGAVDLVRLFADLGVRMAVVTSAGRRWAERVLDETLGIRELVDVVVSAGDVARGKPSPEGYLAACAALGVRPADCLGFEDSSSGVRALAEAGVRGIVGVATTSAPGELTAWGARWTVSDLHPGRVSAVVAGV
jgi:sugar-phosphatase